MVRSPTLTEVISSAKLMLAASAAATKLTVSVTQPPPPTGSGLTMADELLNNGGISWLSFFVIPGLNWQGIQFVLTDFGICPKYASYSQVSADELDVLGASPQIQKLVSHPVAGTRFLTTDPTYQTVNCTPGVVANESISHNYAAPAFKIYIPAGTQIPWAVGPINGFMSFGNASITFGGKTYQAIGTYERWTYASAHDPSPGFYSQGGWIDTPLYTLYFEVFGSPPVFTYGQIWWKDTQTMENLVTPVAVGGTCPNYVYTVVSSRGTDTIKVTVSRFAVGTCVGGFGFGPAVSSLGGNGIAMTDNHR